MEVLGESGVGKAMKPIVIRRPWWREEMVPGRAVDRAENGGAPSKPDHQGGEDITQIGRPQREQLGAEIGAASAWQLDRGRVKAMANTASAKISIRWVPRTAPSPGCSSSRGGSWDCSCGPWPLLPLPTGAAGVRSTTAVEDASGVHSLACSGSGLSGWPTCGPVGRLPTYPVILLIHSQIPFANRLRLQHGIRGQERPPGTDESF